MNHFTRFTGKLQHHSRFTDCCHNLVVMMIALWCVPVLLCAAEAVYHTHHSYHGDNINISKPWKYPFLNPDLPWDMRVNDLVDRLTLEEIIVQTTDIPHQATPAIPRLGIKPFVWNTECLRGQKRTNTTAFPQALGLAAAFSGPLIYNMSRAVSYELRGRNNKDRKGGTYVDNHGLTCFSPVINIMRHPLWGRNQETYGEDPYLSGILSQYYVWGLQGQHPRYIRAASGCKHFDVHGGPENIPQSRFSFNSMVSTRDWRMTFLPQFKMCVEAGTYNLMCSFNSINGVPACANKQLLTDIARTEWGFSGHVISDDGAIREIMTAHKYLSNATVTAATVIKAGCNQELGGNVLLHQIDALKQGLLTMREIRDNIKPLFYTRMRLGEFDPDWMNPYSDLNMTQIQSATHRELAVLAATMSFVLLKNTNNLLPLRNMYQRIAIVGPFANTTDQLFGDYSSDVVKEYTRTVYQGLYTLSSTTVLAPGCSDTACLQYDRTSVQAAATDSELVIVCLGTGLALEMEGKDRSSIALPGQQLQLLQDAVKFSNAPVVLLLFNAGPLDITWAKSSTAVQAILECFFPAQATGEALYRIITGAEVPAGRLPATWPTHIQQVPPITDYTMEGRTYRYYHGEPLYPFGYGLSYSSFTYKSLSVQPQMVRRGEDVMVTGSVINNGPYDADEVIQMYISWHNTSVPVPRWQLSGFTRQRIVVGQSHQFRLRLHAEQLYVWLNDNNGWGILPGVMDVYVGGQQPHQTTTLSSNVLSDSFTIIV